MYKAIIAVGLGGFAGSVLRYLVSRLVSGVNFLSLPLGTLLVNVVGCFVLGLLTSLFSRTQGMSPELRLLLTTGLCGGFTTFSTFMGENFEMARGGHFALLTAYVVISLAAGFVLFYAGYALSGKVNF